MTNYGEIVPVLFLDFKSSSTLANSISSVDWLIAEIYFALFFSTRGLTAE